MICHHRTRTSMYRIVQPDGRALIIPHGRCRRCGEVVSLGPSDDRSFRVRVEIRAAEVVAALDDDGQPSSDEGIGVWIGWEADRHPADTLMTVDRQAGYLARAIATHDASLLEMG